MTVKAETNFEQALLGLRVGGKYVVECILGRGGMGCVALGRHEQLGQQVAIKFMLASVAGNEALHARFFREAQLAATLQSPHVVRVFDVGTLDDGLPFMVMEYLEGRSLADELERVTRFPVATAAAYLLQALDAIEEAHALGVVHRDLKPDNLFLTTTRGGERTVKVLDFGISKVDVGADANPSLTQTTAVLGSPLYMSPEQIRASKGVDARADIWSLGVVLHQLVEGTLPFEGESIGDLFGKIQYVDPPAMQHGSPELEAVVRRCLSRDPAGRYQNARALAEALRSFTTASESTGAPASVPAVRPSPRAVAVARAYSDKPPALAREGPISSTAVAVESRQGVSLVAPSTGAVQRPSARLRAVLATTAVAVVALGGVGFTLRAGRAHPPSEVRGSPEAMPEPAGRGALPAAPAASSGPATASSLAQAEGIAVSATSAPLASSKPRPARKVPSAATSGTARKVAPVESEPDRGF